MIPTGADVQYIVGAYLGVALVTLGLVVWTIREARAQKAKLADLEARGVRRRSAGADSGK